MVSFILLLLGLAALACWASSGAIAKNTSGGKLEYLEGVRGFAAFLVIIFHFFMVFYPAMLTGKAKDMHHPVELLLAQTPAFILYSGTFFVAIFFVLSGFVLSYAYLLKQKKEILISSALRRYIRLGFPVVFTTLIYCILMSLGYLSQENGNALAGITHSKFIKDIYNYEPSFLVFLKDILYNCFFVLYTYKYNYALWTMAFEFIGSLLLYAFFLTFGVSKLRWAGYLLYIGLISLVFKAPQLTAFVFGMVLCDLYVHGYMKILSRPLIKVIALVVGIYLAGYNINLDPSQVQNTVYSWLLLTMRNSGNLFFQGWFIVIVGATLLLAVIINDETLRRIFGGWLGRFLGKVSFSLYLIHYSILLTFSTALFSSFKASMGYDGAFLLSLLASIPLILLCAYILYQYVDRASHLLGKSFYQAVKSKALSVYQAVLCQEKITLTASGVEGQRLD
jgi:peptidoglycan/LPS O-acetylase OafA/YrhL